MISDELTEKSIHVSDYVSCVPLPVLQLMSGEAIRELRERHGLSQAMLAAYIGLSPATVVKWEREEKKPNGAALRLLNLIDRKGLEVLR